MIERFVYNLDTRVEEGCMLALDAVGEALSFSGSFPSASFVPDEEEEGADSEEETESEAMPEEKETEQQKEMEEDSPPSQLGASHPQSELSQSPRSVGAKRGRDEDEEEAAIWEFEKYGVRLREGKGCLEVYRSGAKPTPRLSKVKKVNGRPFLTIWGLLPSESRQTVAEQLCTFYNTRLDSGQTRIDAMHKKLIDRRQREEEERKTNRKGKKRRLV